jgi:serine/threonine protein kinase
MKELIGTKIIDDKSNDIFLIEKTIGSGSFGHVFQCIDESKNRFALKYPIKETKEQDTFSNEIKIYNHLNCGTTDFQTKDNSSNNKSVYIPTYRILTTVEPKQRLILIELLGSNINDITVLFPKHRLPLRETILITIKLITVIKFIHSKGIIHQDIKPENFIFGVEQDDSNLDSNKLYCIDFGLSKIYMNNNVHVPCKKTKSFCGTARYAPIAAHKHVTQSRRSDLESVFYMIIYLFKGKLPWMNKTIRRSEKTTKYKLIQKLKEEVSLETLTSKLPEEFLDAFKYIQNLEFDEKPSYSSLKNMFIRLYIKDFGHTGFNLIPNF